MSNTATIYSETVNFVRRFVKQVMNGHHRCFCLSCVGGLGTPGDGSDSGFISHEITDNIFSYEAASFVKKCHFC